MSRTDAQMPPHGRRRSNTAQSIARPHNNTAPVPSIQPLDIGSTKTLNVWVHDAKESPNVIFNRSWWPGVMEGDVLRFTAAGSDESSSGFLFIVPKDDGCSKPQLQVSIPKPMAESCRLKNNGEVTARKVNPSNYDAHYVELIFQDQYLGRNDMWRLGEQLAGQCIHRAKEISFINAPFGRIQDIYIDGQKVSAARITPATKIIYRSLSAKVMIFIQVCEELWEFSTDGERNNEKIVHSFLPALFAEWKKAGTNHIVTIVLISRVYYEEAEREYAAGPLQQAEDGKWYKDFFKVVADLEVIKEWKPTLVSLKTSFVDFQRDILLAHHYHRGIVDPKTGVTEARLVGRISCAHDGPVLEAINLALNPTETHYIDRSLAITGSTTILVSPGTGYFRVSKPLLRLTTTRLLDQGFIVSLICLARPPLHQSPILSFQGFEPELKSDNEGRLGSRMMDPLWGGDEEPEEAKEKYTFWWEPFWLSISFWDQQMDLPFRQDRFVARAKMHEIQMLGLLEHDVLSSIEVPFLPEEDGVSGANISPTDDDEHYLSKAEADTFDHNVFAVPDRRGYNFSRGSFMSSTSTIVPSSSYRSDRRSMLTSQRSSITSGNIPPIEESPRHIMSDLPPDDSPRSVLRVTTSALSTSPSQSSVHSQSSTLSERLRTNIRRDSAVSVSRSSLASKLTPSWLFNPFKAAASEPKTSNVLASASPSTPSTPKLPLVKSSASLHVLRASPAEPALATSFSATTPRAISIKKPANTTLRSYEDETPTMGRIPRRSPLGTPQDDVPFPKRRGTGNSLTSSSPYGGTKGRTNPSRFQPSLGNSQINLARRWQHLNARPSYKHDIKWKALVTPACLPLTAETFPSASELDSSYDMFQYGFVVDPSEMRSFVVKFPSVKGSTEQVRRAWALVVMRGMAAVRLAQGFQFVLKPDNNNGADKDERRSSFFRPRSVEEDDFMSLPSGAAQVLRSVSSPVYLSMSNEIHRLAYIGDSVQIRRYVRRMPPMPAVEYKCLIWPKLGVGYTEHKTTFSSTSLENYGWNRLDFLVAGYERDFSESLRYWRTRFVVLPTREPPSINLGPGAENLNDEEIRIMGMDRLAEQFTKLRWGNSEEKAPPCSLPPIRFLPTTLGPAACVLDEGLVSQLDELHATGPLKKKMKSDREISSMTPAAIAKAIKEEGLIRHNQWHGQQFPSSFIGYDVVSWMLREFKDVSSRPQAIEIGAKLLEGGLFEHCRFHHGFLDGHYFYRLKGEHTMPMTPRGWFRTARNMTSDDSMRSGGKTSSPRRNRKRLILSQSTVIDVDPNKKSDQAEAVVLHHDVFHNPNVALHFEVTWIGTTARCIEETLRQFNRCVERYGLKIVEAYVSQISDIRDRNPFQSCFPVHLALPPPNLSHMDKRVPEGVEATHFFEYALLRKFDFILDMEAADMYPEKVDVVYSYRRSPFKYSQFIHRSGVALVQVIGGQEGFLFLTNRLLGPGRMGTSKSKERRLTGAAEEVRIALHNFCSDAAALEQFYEEEQAQLKVILEDPPPLTL